MLAGFYSVHLLGLTKMTSRKDEKILLMEMGRVLSIAQVKTFCSLCYQDLQWFRSAPYFEALVIHCNALRLILQFDKRLLYWMIECALQL